MIDNPMLGFKPALQSGVLVRRYKRFLADVEVDRELLTMHCANTGAMLGCSSPGSIAWYSTNENKKRKYVHSLELVETGGDLVCVNTHRANQLMKACLDSELLMEFAARNDPYRSEVAIPSGHGRFDFGNSRTYVEVKSVTLMRNGRGCFPDARTVRGERHVTALGDLAEMGARSVLCFLAMHTGIQNVGLSDDIDPQYASSVRRAIQRGVEVLAYGCDVAPNGLAVRSRIPFAEAPLDCHPEGSPEVPIILK